MTPPLQLSLHTSRTRRAMLLGLLLPAGYGQDVLYIRGTQCRDFLRYAALSAAASRGLTTSSWVWCKVTKPV